MSGKRKDAARRGSTAEIITVGDELLKGSVVNTNACFLGHELTQLGFEVRAQVTCRDIREMIGQKLSEALTRSDLILLSGGLGPTPDDVTREALADFFGVPLIFSTSQFRQIRKHYRRYGHRVPPLVRREAFLPENAVPLINRYGIAIGFYLRFQNRLLVVLPGVPVELQKMVRELVRPLIRRAFPNLRPRPSLAVKTVGLSEPKVMQLLGKDFFKEPFEFGIYPQAGEVMLRIQTSQGKTLRDLHGKLKKRLSQDAYAFEDISIAEAVGRLLLQKRRTLAVAESCTGGLLASEITKIPGASRYFKGGVTVYSNRMKTEWMGVPPALLAKKGPVSGEVAQTLAREVCRKMKTDYGIGLTGIAGPKGMHAGRNHWPIGTVFIAVASGRKVRLGEYRFFGDRGQIQTKAAKKALEMLWREIR